MKRLAMLSLVVGCPVAFVACKETPKQRAQEVAATKEFWPEAPKPTSKSGTRTLRYQPANITGYRLTATGGTPGSAKLSLDFTMTLDLVLAAGKAPEERDAKVGVLALDMTGPGVTMKMRIDDKGFFIDDKSGTAQTWTRDNPGPFDIDAMLDTPFSTLVFEDNRRMVSRVREEHPFSALDMGDMLDSALVLFPDLPEAAIAPGHTWKVVRNTAVGATGARVDVTYEMTYAGDGACPSGAKQCALIQLVAASKDATVQVEGNTMQTSYGFAGKIYFDTARGTVDESRVHMDMDVRAGAQSMTVGATYVVKPI